MVASLALPAKLGELVTVSSPCCHHPSTALSGTESYREAVTLAVVCLHPVDPVFL